MTPLEHAFWVWDEMLENLGWDWFFEEYTPTIETAEMVGARILEDIGDMLIPAILSSVRGVANVSCLRVYMQKTLVNALILRIGDYA